MERNAERTTRDDVAGSLGPSPDASSATEGTDTAGSTAPIADEARTPRDAVRNALGTIREKAHTFQATLADRLDAGAERVRERGNAAPEKVAKGMHGTADWLRNGDVGADVARQVREHPGRSLLIALGLGLIIGRSFRSK